MFIRVSRNYRSFPSNENSRSEDAVRIIPKLNCEYRSFPLFRRNIASSASAIMSNKEHYEWRNISARNLVSFIFDDMNSNSSSGILRIRHAVWPCHWIPFPDLRLPINAIKSMQRGCNSISSLRKRFLLSAKHRESLNYPRHSRSLGDNIITTCHATPCRYVINSQPTTVLSLNGRNLNTNSSERCFPLEYGTNESSAT
jgi:hypothetical protein